jgi:hypothetical protein
VFLTRQKIVRLFRIVLISLMAFQGTVACQSKLTMKVVSNCGKPTDPSCKKSNGASKFADAPTIYYSNSRPTIKWLADASASEYYSSMDSTEPSRDVIGDSTTSYVPTTYLADGKYTLYVWKRDKAKALWTAYLKIKVIIDTVGPKVVSVSSSAVDGIYGPASVIGISVVFDKEVVVTGTAVITMNSNAGATASYSSGSGTNTLVFNYTVAVGENAADLDVSSGSALRTTGTIKGPSGVNAVLTLPTGTDTTSLQTNKNIVVNSSSPYVTSVSSSTANGRYHAGQTIGVTVAFSASVDVTGIPQLTLETGATDGVADYASGSGTSTLTFNYIVGAGEDSADLDYGSVNALVLNGGTIIKNGASDVATLALPAVGGANSIAGQKAIIVDTTAPAIISFGKAAGQAALTNATTVDFTLVFSEYVSGFAAGDFTFSGGSASWALSTTDNITWTLRGTSANDGVYGDIALNPPGTLADQAGNAFDAGQVNWSDQVTVDTTPPTLSLTSTSPNTTGSTQTPNVIGTVDDAGATITLYSDSSCTTAISGGASQATLQGAGIPITTNLPANVMSTIYGRAADALGNLSVCNDTNMTIDYTHASVEVDHIVYTNDTDRSVNYIYGVPGGTFTEESGVYIIGAGNKIKTSAITLNNADVPMIGYYWQNTGTGSGSVRYGVRTGASAWNLSGDLYTAAMATLGMRLPVDLAWSNAATPFVDMVYQYMNYVFHYQRYASATWEGDSSLFTNTSTSSPPMGAVAVDSNHVSHLVAHHVTGTGPWTYGIDYYTRASGGSWTAGTPPTKNGSALTCQHARNPNIYFDTTAVATNPHVAYFCHDGVNWGLVHAVYSADTWTYENIVTSGLPGSVVDAAYIGFAMYGGKAHVAFIDSVGALKYATNTSGSWVVSTIEGFIGGTTYISPQIGINSSGSVRVYYVKDDGSAPQIRVAYSEAGLGSPINVLSQSASAGGLQLGKNVGINGVHGNSRR